MLCFSTPKLNTKNDLNYLALQGLAAPRGSSGGSKWWPRPTSAAPPCSPQNPKLLVEVLLGFAGLPSTTSFKIIFLLLIDFPPNSFPHCASSKPKFTVCGRREGKAESSSSTGLPTAGEDTLRHAHYWRHPVRPTIFETPTISESSCDTHNTGGIL